MFSTTPCTTAVNKVGTRRAKRVEVPLIASSSLGRIRISKDYSWKENPGCAPGFASRWVAAPIAYERQCPFWPGESDLHEAVRDSQPDGGQSHRRCDRRWG